MYTCDRCGTSFGRRTPVVESCPRCLARDGVRVALTFKLFQNVRPTGEGEAPIPLRARTSRLGGLEEAVRRQIATGAR